MIVVDASVILEILSQTPIGIEFGSALDGRSLHAPHLIDLEVASALRQWEIAGVANPENAATMLRAFQAMRIQRHPHDALLPAFWALRHNLTAYDAAHLALARSLDAELVTMDGGLRRMARRR